MDPSSAESQAGGRNEKFTTLKALAPRLGFATHAACKKWLNSTLFTPYFDELFAMAIKPLQDKAKKANKAARGRVMSLKAVEFAIELGESGGRHKYLRRHGVDKTNWTITDWYAYCILLIQTENESDFEGIFFSRRQLSAHEKHARIWAALQYSLYLMTPSQVALRAKRVEIAANRPLKSAQVLEKPYAELPDEDDTTEVDEQGTEVVEQYFPQDFSFKVADAPTPSGYEERQEIREAVGRDAKEKTVSNYSKMLIERRSAIMSLEDRYWRYHLITRLMSTYQAPTVVADEARILTNIAHDVEDEAWRRDMEQAAQNRNFSRSPVTLATDEDAERYKRNQVLLDSKAFQPQNHIEACQNVGIEDPEELFLEGMSPTARFKFWQPVVMNWLQEKRDLQLQGALLCDSMGLGKTWEAVGYCLSRLLKRVKAIKEDRDYTYPKPTMVVCLPSLLKQWEREIMKCTNKFKIVQYHGDYRSSSEISMVLTKQHPLFDAETEGNAATIILTTPKVMALRHGPNALKEYRIKTLRWTEATANASLHVVDNDWPGLLYGCIDTLIIDEATTIKNPLSHSHLACKWLVAGFNVLITGTPDLNSVHDLRGYMPFIEPKESPWTVENLRHWGVSVECNPFTDCRDNSPAAKLLRPTVKAVDKFLFVDNIDQLHQGVLLKSLFQACMVRRSFVSILNGRVIGDEIPPAQHLRAVTQFTAEEQRKYDDAKQYHERHLIRVDENGKICWNFKHYRALLLLCTWTGFQYIMHDFEADNLPVLLRRDNPLWWICKKYCAVNPTESCPREEEVELQVAMLMRGAPKIRMLLALTADHIILNKEKMVLFASLPGQVGLIYAVLKALKVDVLVVHAGLSTDERTAIQDCFNEHSNSSMVYLTSYPINSSGINLQDDCHRCVLFDVPPSLGVGLQAAARVHRVGQTEVTELITLVLAKSFNDRQLQNNLRKAVPGIMATLDNSIFQAKLQHSPEDADEMVVTIADWVLYKGRLVQADDPRVYSQNLDRVSAEEVVRKVLSETMGTPIGWEGMEEMGGTQDD